MSGTFFTAWATREVQPHARLGLDMSPRRKREGVGLTLICLGRYLSLQVSRQRKGLFFFFLMNPVMLKKCASQTYCVNSWEGEGKVTHLPRCQVLPETPGVYCGGVPTPTLKTNRLNSCAWSLSLCRAARLLWPVADARSLRREC